MCASYLGQHHFVLVHGGQSDEGVPVDQLDDLGRGWFQPRSGRRLGGNNLDFVPASVGDRRRAQTVLRRSVGGGSVDQFFAVGDDRRGRQGKCSRAVGAGRSDDLQAGRRTRNQSVLMVVAIRSHVQVQWQRLDGGTVAGGQNRRHRRKQLRLTSDHQRQRRRRRRSTARRSVAQVQPVQLER